MDRSRLPLNALRAFEAAARHLNVTRAALELCVTQAAVSHHIKLLEDQLGAPLFRRLPRGLVLTDEGAALVPMLNDTFDRMAATLDRFTGGCVREIVNIGVVGTFATGWLLPRLPEFEALHPYVDLRIMTNNNRVDLAGEGLDYAIRYGNGAWHGTDAVPILDAPMTPLCAAVVARRLTTPADLGREVLLRSYRPDEWKLWFDAAGTATPPIRGPIFDASPTMAAAAAGGTGVALLPGRLFEQDLASGRLIQPFNLCVDAGRYWLTRLKSRPETAAMAAVKEWLQRAESPDWDQNHLRI
jgi:LysR family transcriptional regulator, regulator of gene expression of beta-lactamase